MHRLPPAVWSGTRRSSLSLVRARDCNIHIQKFMFQVWTYCDGAVSAGVGVRRPPSMEIERQGAPLYCLMSEFKIHEIERQCVFLQFAVSKAPCLRFTVFTI